MTPRVEPADSTEPIPEEWISEKPTPEETKAWWAEWEKLPPIERSRPAAEVLAEVRGKEPYNFGDE